MLARGDRAPWILNRRRDWAVQWLTAAVRQTESAAIRRAEAAESQAGATEWLSAAARRAQAVVGLAVEAGRAQTTVLRTELTSQAALEPVDIPAEERTRRTLARPSVHWPRRAVYSELLWAAGIKPAARWREFVPIVEAGGLPQRQQVGQTHRSRLRLLLQHKAMLLTRHLCRGSRPRRRTTGGVPWGLTVYSRYLHLQQAKRMESVAVTMPCILAVMGSI